MIEKRRAHETNGAVPEPREGVRIKRGDSRVGDKRRCPGVVVLVPSQAMAP